MYTAINIVSYIISSIAIIIALFAAYAAYRMRKQITIARAMMRHPAKGLKALDEDKVWTEDGNAYSSKKTHDSEHHTLAIGCPWCQEEFDRDQNAY